MAHGNRTTLNPEDATDKIVIDVLSLSLCPKCRREIERGRAAITRTNARLFRESFSKVVEHCLFQMRDSIHRQIWGRKK